MSVPHDEFAAVLLARRIVTPEQLVDAWRIAAQTGIPLEDALVHRNYATACEIAAARAAWFGLDSINLTELDIPLSLIELMPESVARENIVLPIALEGRTLTVAMADLDFDTLQKLTFILNMEVRPVLAPRRQIIEAINHHYGQSETESVDSMLAEFTDTAIDFTRTDSADSVCELTLEDDTTCKPRKPAEAEVPLAGTTSAPRLTNRRATVRYFHRMNPQRMFPLLVVLSRGQVEEVVKRGVRQACSQSFQVAQGSVVDIEPVLPGCSCYPPREQVRVGAGEASVTFWVVPGVLGQVMNARVIVRQDGAALAEVPLEMYVTRQSMTHLMGALSLVLPFVLLLLKHFNLDFESQLKDGFGLYARLAGWLVQCLTPEVLTGLLLAVTVALYFWLRPRQREVFWDIKTRAEEEAPTPTPAVRLSDRIDADGRFDQAQAAFERGDESEGERLLAELLEAQTWHAPALLCLAQRRDRAGDHAAALKLYERALATGRGGAIDYFRASLAAGRTGDLRRALDILQRAESSLPPTEMKGVMWFNMGCFAARLGRFADALCYLNRAVDRGFADLEKFRHDPDLEPLRWHAGFRRLLSEIGR